MNKVFLDFSDGDSLSLCYPIPWFGNKRLTSMNSQRKKKGNGEDWRLTCGLSSAMHSKGQKDERTKEVSIHAK